MSVVLKDNRPTKKISLPNYEGSEVIIYPSLLVGDIVGGSKVDDQVQFGIESMVKLIKSWNFVDEDEKELPVNIDNLKKLNIADIEYLINRTTEFAESVKKN